MPTSQVATTPVSVTPPAAYPPAAASSSACTMHGTPTTDTALYEELRRLFGVGDYDEGSSTIPWHKYVQIEVGKMKRWRTKRGLELPVLWRTARYCKAKRIQIAEPFELTKHVRDSLRWENELKLETSRCAGDEDVTLAVSRERALASPDEEWIGKLLRAQGDYRKEVLAAWAISYSSRTTGHRQTV